MYDRAPLPLFVLALAACGVEPPPPGPSTFVPEAPRPVVPEEAPVESTARALGVDAPSSWLTLVATDGDRRAEPELAVVGGAVHVEDDQVARVALELADIHIDADLLPPRGLEIVSPRLEFTPTGAGRAYLVIEWSVLDSRGQPRAIRPIELDDVAFDVVLGDDVSIDGAASGTVWRLDGLFELSDLAFSVVAR